MNDRDNNDLIAAVSRGDREALQILYERNVNFVFRTAFRYLGNEDDAEDVTQEVFVGLIRGAGRFKPNAKFTTWLYRVVANRCLNHEVSAYRRLRNDRISIDQIEELPDEACTTPEQQIEEREREAMVREALDRLPDRQRLAVVLKRFENLSYRQIAQAMNCSIGSVESLLFRARQNLKKTFFP